MRRKHPKSGTTSKGCWGNWASSPDNDARTIIAASRPDPFARTDETGEDKTLKNICEIHADGFETRNPVWQRYIQKMAITASAKLGIVDGDGRVVGISAELNNLSLHEKGASFESPECLVLHLIQL
jgi:hypothetical protein